MKISFYYPSQSIVKKDLIFLEYLPEIEILHNTCDSTCDLIYVSTMGMLPQAIQAKNQYNKPLISWVWDLPYNSQTEWDLTTDGLNENKHRPQDCNYKANLLKQCDKVISASKWTQKVLKENYNIDSEQIYFYINQKELDAIPSVSKTNRIIQISRFAWNKKWEHTLYSTKDLDYEISLVGVKQTQTYFNYMNKFVNENTKLYQNIPRTKTLELLKSSEILVSPSVFEGWGISPVEALHCNTSVLLSDLPVFQEVYEDTVLYHDRFNREDMKEKLNRLVKDKDLQKKIIEKGKLKIKDFNPKRFSEDFKRIIK